MKSKLFFSSFFVAIITVALLSGCSCSKIQYEPNVFIKDWLIAGPFPNCEVMPTDGFSHDEKCEGFYTDYLKSVGGEKKAVPTDGMKVTYSEKNIERTWFKYSSTESSFGDIRSNPMEKPTNAIHLSKLLKPKDNVVAYAFCQVQSPENQKAILSVGSNDGIRVFFNGEEVHQIHENSGRWLQSDNDYIPVELQKGTNNLMLKIEQGVGEFGYAARFLDYDSVITKIRKNIDSYKKLKVVSVAENLVAQFGTKHKIALLNPEGKVKIELIHENKGKLEEKIIIPGEDAKFLLDNIPDGFLKVKATFPTLHDGDIVSEKTHFQGKLKKHPRVKRVMKDLTIIDKDGKSFFPIGTYGAPVEDYKVIKEAGYNFVVASAEDLDQVHEAGLLAAVHADINNLQEFINKYKNHPAVLCWMLWDEPGESKSDLLYIYDLYNQAYKADNVHPSYLVITKPTVYRTFGRCCDVLAVDTYPVTGGIIEMAGETIADAYEQLDNEIPVWHCGQMFAWPEQRRPNVQEHRFMTYYALMNGAKGLLWYVYKGFGQYLPVDDPELWSAQKTLIAEITELIPLFMEPGFGKDVQLVQENESVKAILKKSPIGTFVLATNTSKTETHQAELKINKIKNGNASVYKENRTVAINNGILKDEFKPLDVHIYKLK